MDWANEGRKAISFVGYAIIAFAIVLFLGGIFIGLVPSSSPFNGAVTNVATGVNSAIGTIANPLFLIPLASVVAIVGIGVLVYMNNATRGAGHGGSYHN